MPCWWARLGCCPHRDAQQEKKSEGRNDFFFILTQYSSKFFFSSLCNFQEVLFTHLDFWQAPSCIQSVFAVLTLPSTSIWDTEIMMLVIMRARKELVKSPHGECNYSSMETVTCTGPNLVDGRYGWRGKLLKWVLIIAWVLSFADGRSL